MEHKFKVGDRVRMTDKGISNWGDQSGGKEGVLRKDDGTSSVPLYVKWDNGGDNCYNPGDIELTGSTATIPTTINFILQYDLDTDPFETFSTLTEVKDRIKVLARRSDLKRDSLKLYHIAKVEKVELSTAIAFISVEEKPVEQVKTKSKAKQPCPQCGKKFKRLNSHIARSHKTL